MFQNKSRHFFPASPSQKKRIKFSKERKGPPELFKTNLPAEAKKQLKQAAKSKDITFRKEKDRGQPNMKKQKVFHPRGP